jgi:hemoglobin
MEREAEETAMESTLYQRLGGKPAVDAAVDLFYDKILKDASLHRFFDGVDMERQRRHQKMFMAMAFGGPDQYAGEGLRDAHAHLVAHGLDDSHFVAVGNHLRSTLQDLGVTNDLVAEVMAIVGSAKNEVLNR